MEKQFRKEQFSCGLGANECSSRRESLLLKVQPAWKHWKCHRVLAKLYASFTKQAHATLKHVFLFFFSFQKGMWQCLGDTMFTNGTGLFENVGVHRRNFLACKRTKAENGQRTNIHPAPKCGGAFHRYAKCTPKQNTKTSRAAAHDMPFWERWQLIDKAARKKYKHRTFRWEQNALYCRTQVVLAADC